MSERRWVAGIGTTYYTTGPLSMPMFSFDHRGHFIGYQATRAHPLIRGVVEEPKALGQAWLYWETYK